MKYAYFPGCSMEGVGRAYALSLAYVNRTLGLDFAKLDDWNCCGATAGHSASHELGLALPARNLALAEQQMPGLPLVTACASCYSRLKYAALAVRGAETGQISRLIEAPLNGAAEILSLLDVYSRPEISAAIRAAIRNPLQGLRAACYYGCLYVRPPEICGAADSENPQNMDELLRLCGATAVDWAFKTECCGAAKHVDAPQESLPLLHSIYKNARANGAQALVTACPMCMMNLDMRQKAVNRAYNEDFALPVYYITELLAVAMGAGLKESGIAGHFQPAQQLLS